MYIKALTQILYVASHGNFRLTDDEQRHYFELQDLKRQKLITAILEDFIGLYADDQWRNQETL